MEGLGSSMSFNLQSFCWVCPSRGGGGRTGCGFTCKLKIQKANSGSNKCKLHIVPSVIILYWFTTCLSWGYDSDDFTSPITNTVGIGNHFTDGKDNLGPGRKEKWLIQPKRTGCLLLQDKIKAWNWNQIFVVRENLDTAMTERQRSRQRGPAGANQPAGLGWAADLARTSRAQE